ncbi:hypothetical protein P7C71_g2932, partial [Lecanoromycetidae sp. Uapishka_2]
MENLSMQDLPQAGGPNHVQQPLGGPPQLPPQDLDKDDYIPEPFKKVSAEEVHALQREETKSRKKTDKARAKKLQGLGFEAEHSGEVLF